MINDRPTEVTSWDEDGRLLLEITITNDRRNGIVLDWHDDRAEKSEAAYVDDQLVRRTY